MFNILQAPTMKNMNVVLRKLNKIKHANENELLLSSSGVVLEVNKRRKKFYKTLSNLVEQMYRRSFHLQYKNQSKYSKNQILSKL